jgi:Ca-activated chloride channel family protein
MKNMLACLSLVLSLAWLAGAGAPAAQQEGGFRFRTGVDLINVAATVTDRNGHFVSGLRKEDFAIYEDGQAREIGYFSADRVPVSLGIALDTSGSMEGDKIAHARQALDRFLYDLLDPEDEIFVYRFDASPELIQDWTTDRDRIARALGRVRPRGGTALYDTVAEAVPLAQSGRHRKKALVIISDGNDTSSETGVGELVRSIRQTEVLVYAIGIDGYAEPTMGTGSSRPPQMPRIPIPSPFPIPGGRRYPPPSPPTNPSPPSSRSRSDDRVNVSALREITDDSGGRTEIIRYVEDLNPATESVADELRKQYFLGYEAPSVKDGRWHSIRVEVRRGSYMVRARRGYIATP